MHEGNQSSAPRDTADEAGDKDAEREDKDEHEADERTRLSSRASSELSSAPSFSD